MSTKADRPPRFKARRLLALAALSYVVVVAAAVEAPNGCFAPTWFNVVLAIFLPLGLLSTFAAVVAWGRSQAFHLLASLICAAVTTSPVAVLAIYVTFALTIDPGCFS